MRGIGRVGKYIVFRCNLEQNALYSSEWTRGRGAATAILINTRAGARTHSKCLLRCFIGGIRANHSPYYFLFVNNILGSSFHEIEIGIGIGIGIIENFNFVSTH
jgi:hypothetical protein